MKSTWEIRFRYKFGPVEDGEGNKTPLILNDYVLDLIVKWIDKEFGGGK